MNGEQLYQGLKAGQINKTQLTNKELGEVYKYMVNSNRVSVKEIKPSVAQRFRLSANEYKPLKVEVPEIEIPETERPEKQSLFGKIGNFFKTQSQPQSQLRNATVNPRIDINTTPNNYAPKQSTNPENELVDLLSNLSMPKTEPTLDRGRTTKHERSRTPATLPILKDTIQDVKGGIDNTKVNYELGKLSEIENQLWAKYRTSQSEEDLLKAEQASQMTQDYVKSNPNVGQGNWLTQNYAQYMPQMLNQMKAGVEGASKGALVAGGTAALLGQAGPQLAMPEEIITVPTAMFAGGRAGYITGVGQYSYDNMAGAAYKGLLDAGIPNDIALELSRDEGIISSLIEATGAGVDIATLGIGKLFEKPAGQVAKNRILSALKAYGINVASEGLEEGLQEKVSIWTEKRALGDKREATPQEDINRILQAAEGGIAIAAVSGGGNAIGNIAVNTINNQRIAKAKQTLDTDLNTMYTAIDNGTPTTEQDLNKAIEVLQNLEEQYPDLKEHLQGHINKIDKYKERIVETFKQPQTNEIDMDKQTVEQDTNIAQIEDKGVTEDIKKTDNIIPIESLKPQEVLQESNENVTETQQLDNVTNVTKNVGYHAGDLGKAEHFGRQYGSNRGTGHFGTGTYFVGNQKNIDLGGYKDRPVHTINFDGYNLYKPAKESQARKLHDFLKFINTYYETSKKILLNEEYDNLREEMYYDTVDDVIRDLGNGTVEDVINQLRILGLDESLFEEREGMTVEQYIDEFGDSYDKKHELSNYINEAKSGVESTQRALNYKTNFDDNVTELFGISKEEAVKITDEIYNEIHKQSGDRPLYGNKELDKSDSASTRFMKKLGYEGVDVRHIPSFDDTEYGSVIYDLKDTPQATEQPTTKETIPTEQIVEEDINVAKMEDKDVAKTKFTSKKHKSPKSKNSTPYQAVLENDEVKIYYYDGRKKFGGFTLDYKAYLNIEETLARRKFIDKSMTNYLLERNGKAFNYKLNEQGMEDLKLYGFEEESESVQKAIDEVLKEAGLYKQTFREQFDEHSKKRKEKEQLQPKQEETKTDITETKQDITEEKQTYRYYLTQRPPSPGTFPKGTTDVVSFDDKTDGAWGYVEYDKPLTEKQIDDYELTENVTEMKQLTTGKKGIAKDNEGNTIEFIYEVVNANDLITSHTTELAVNNNYPSELQPRERTRAASQLQVNDIINNLQPDFLGENPKISDGSPIVGNDNIVESGNGRTIALTKMYQLKHDNQTKYVEWLKDNAETFGIDKDNLPDNPILVRKRTTEVDRADFVKKANESSIATMSATETARSDADKLTNESLTLFIANDNGIINTTENKGFIGRFISEVIPKNEQNKYITDKGELSQEGLARVRNAIFYKAYGDINLMNKLAESLDNNAKNITNTMLAVAPKVVDIKVNISKGNLHNVDYSSSIAQAANEYMALKETGKDVELYLQQESLFDNEDTALIKDIIAIFNTNNRSVKRMSTIFNKLFDSVENLGNPNQINMFGETETPDRVSVLEETLRRLENEDNAQITLFQSGREESSESSRSDSGEQGKTKGYKGGQSFTGATTASLVDMSRKLKKPTEIRKDITKKFGVPNTSKKFNRSKKFLGYYKVMPEVIRLRYDNDIGTVMHELGHHFDKKYGFNSLNKQLITDMINKMNPAFKNNYQKSELPGEAIAEFLRYYTTDPTTAEQFAGDFYDLFEHTLSKEDLKNIQDIRSDVLRWVNAERAEKRQSTIVPLNKKGKASERISETIKFEKNNALLFDRYAPIQEFAKTVEKLTGRKLPASLNPYMLVERTYKNNSTIEGMIKGQLRDTQFKPLNTDDSLQKIVDDVKKDITPFEDYLKLKHAITLAEKDHMIYNPDIYNNTDDMQQDLGFIEQQYPQFIELSERLYDWYDKFFKAWVVDTNMLGEDSKKIYAKMRQEYPYYVPMFRVREDGSGKQASSSLTDQKAPVDRLSEKGSDRDTISPIDNMVTQVSRMVNAYTKNNVMRAVVENYNTVDGLGGFIDRVPPDMEKQILSTQSIKDSLETEFEDVDNIDDIINSIPDLVENYKPLTKSKDREIVGVITKSGKRQFYQVFDKTFLNSLTNMNPTQLDATVKIIASVRRTTTGLTTGLNPIFGIASNAPRDFTQAYVFGSYKNPAEYVYQYAKALTGVIAKNSNYKTFKDIGGVYGSSMTSELRNKNDFIRRLTKYRKGQKVGAKNALSYIGELILDLNDAIETAPRLAEFNKAYKIAKKRGDGDYDATLYALSRADDVTLNFSRRGEIMNTAVGQSIPYLNAGLQGMDKLRRGLFTGEERTQTLIKSITMLTIPTILLWLAHRDDEDYEKLTKGIKDNYWILWKNPDGSFARIPKPKDLSTIFSANFERALNAYFKEEGAGAFEGFYSTIADSLLPPVDTIFRPLIDVVGNEKWSGGKIVPMAMDYVAKTEQYDETTSKIGIVLAQLISKVAPGSNFASPKNVDYILDQYYGGLADILLPMTTPTTYVDVDTLKEKYDYLAMPMAAIMKTGELIGRKFKADPSYSNDAVNDFYDLRDKTMKANKSYKSKGAMSDDVDIIAENQFKAYYKSISSMWKTIDTIDSFANKTLPDEYKESFKKLINQSRFADSEKQKVINDIKDNKLNRESITLLQKTIRDEIVKLADKAIKEYKTQHKDNNKQVRDLISNQGQ